MAAPRYNFIDITPEGYEASPVDINSNGIVIANARGGQSILDGMVWDNGKVTILSPLESSEQTTLHSINDKKVIVGAVSVEEVDFAAQWTDGKLRFLDPPEDGCSGMALDVNNHGTIVGLHDIAPDDKSISCIWYDERFTDIFPDFVPYEFAGEPIAFAINDRGLIAGHIDEFGFIKERDNYRKIHGSKEEAIRPSAINKTGVVVGRVFASSEEYAFMYWGTEIESLGTIVGSSSVAYDINDSNVIVGASSYQLGSQEWHGFVYRNEKMYDLNELVNKLGDNIIKDAQAINNHGQIVASADLGEQSRALLLNPIT